MLYLANEMILIIIMNVCKNYTHSCRVIGDPLQPLTIDHSTIGIPGKLKLFAIQLNPVFGCPVFGRLLQNMAHTIDYLILSIILIVCLFVLVSAQNTQRCLTGVTKP